MFENTIFTGISNPDSLCYMISVLQILYSMENMRNFTLSDAIKNDDNLLYVIKVLFTQMINSASSGIEVDEILETILNYYDTTKSYENQGDSSKYLIELLSQIKKSTTTSNVESFTSSFRGTIIHSITKNDITDTKIEPFYYIPLNIRTRNTTTSATSTDATSSTMNIHQSLGDYTKINTFTLPTPINTEATTTTGATISITKRIQFHILPRYLLCHLRRFEYNRITQCVEKLHDYYPLSRYLDMKPYIYNNISSSSSTISSSSSSSVSTSCFHSLSRDINQPLYGTNSGDDSVCYSNSNNDSNSSNEYIYELRGVIVHEGSAQDGHYYTLLNPQPHHYYHHNNNSNNTTFTSSISSTTTTSHDSNSMMNENDNTTSYNTREDSTFSWIKINDDVITRISSLDELYSMINGISPSSSSSSSTTTTTTTTTNPSSSKCISLSNIEEGVTDDSESSDNDHNIPDQDNNDHYSHEVGDEDDFSGSSSAYMVMYERILKQ